MEAAEKVIVAYSGLTVPQAVILGILLTLIVSLAVWLISNYGLTIKNFSIGGSKKLLDNSRHDSFLKEDLTQEVEALKQEFVVDLKFLTKRSKYRLFQKFGFECFFVNYTVNSLFDSILEDYYLRNDFINKLARSNRTSLEEILVNKLVEAFSDNESRVKNITCKASFPDSEELKRQIKDVVNSFLSEAVVISEGFLEKRIRTYEEHKEQFKDPFFKENACEKRIRETKILLESIE